MPRHNLLHYFSYPTDNSFELLYKNKPSEEEDLDFISEIQDLLDIQNQQGTNDGLQVPDPDSPFNFWKIVQPVNQLNFFGFIILMIIMSLILMKILHYFGILICYGTFLYVGVVVVLILMN